MPTARVNGLDLNYQLEGDGAETLVLVSGLADELLAWEQLMPAFRDAGLRVLRFDNRGSGASDKPDGPYSAPMLADDAIALVDELGIERFHLMGHSMGGMVCQEIAIAHPDRLRSLVLACSYAEPGEFGSRMLDLWSDLAQAEGVPFVMRDVALWAFTVDFFEDRTEELQQVEALMADAVPLEAYLAQLAVIRTHDTAGRLDQITSPTLVLAGASDILVPQRHSRRLADAIPGAEWRAVPGGHACLWEYPEPFGRAVVEWVQAHS